MSYCNDRQSREILLNTEVTGKMLLLIEHLLVGTELHFAIDSSEIVVGTEDDCWSKGRGGGV